MSKSKDKVYDRYRAWRHIDIVKYIFILYMSSFYLVYMDNMYFNITATRAFTFEYGVLGMAVLLSLAVTVEVFLIEYYKVDIKYEPDTKIIALPEMWAGLFLLANLVSFLISSNKAAAYSGSNGRRMGLLMIICLVAAFAVLASKVYVNKVNFYVLAGVTAFCYVISYLQHFGLDPFGLIKDVTEKQKQMFVSTFGNINTFGSYICIATPIFAALLIYTKDIVTKMISGTILVMSSMAMLVSKSDNVYLGLGAAFILLLFLSIKDKKLVCYILALTLLSAGLFLMSLLKLKYGGSTKHINGIAKLIGDWRITLVLFIFLLAVYLVLLTVEKRNEEKFIKFQNKTLMAVIACLILVAGIVLFILGRKMGNTDLFTFNDKWGTYRGYIWRRLFSVYKDGSFIHKLFGFGNETIAEVMKPFHDEMVNITGKTYDNAHNELLQYLVTTGLFGMISYIGIFVSSIIYIVKRADKDPVAVAMAASATGYIFQGLVNLNQPITTPLYFTVLGIGIGYLRYKNKGYGKFHEKEAK